MSIQPKYGHLVIVSRSGADGKAFPMHHARVTIGRKETCDIRMQRPQVSKEHCIIRAVSNEMVLTNLSENGAAVNAKVLGVNQQQALRPGDLITIVGRSLRYEAPSEGAVQPIGEISRQVNAIATVRKLDRRQQTHPLGNSERITRKIRLWDEHYSDLRTESPPPGLLDDDPFGGADAASTLLFSRMAARVERGMGRGVGCVGSMASPLKRTMSSGGAQVNRRALVVDMLDGTISTDANNNNNNSKEEDDDDEEVLTEPEPEVEVEVETNGVTALPTPLSVAGSRSVRFGPPLSPEVFDTQAPPSTPLRRGTPLPIKRISSILRPNQPNLMDSIPEAAESPTSHRKSAFDIESPVANRIRNRRRRSIRATHKERRVTIEPLALNGASSPLSSSSPQQQQQQQQQLLVRTKPQESLSDLSRKRKERRRTAPVLPEFGGSAFVPSIAEIAAALGEDVPVYNPPPAKREMEQPPLLATPTKREEDEFGALPLPASALEPLSSQRPPLGLADAFHMTTEQKSSKKDAESEDDEEGSRSRSRSRNEPNFSSEVLLEEQAALQARFSGISERLGQLSVDSISRRRRRQTTAMVFEPLGELADTTTPVSADDTDSVIAHRQRLRRMQERKRRRQTVAELKRRRSSWRGWTGGSPLLVTQSPPLTGAGHVGHTAASSDIEAEFGERLPAASLASTFNSARTSSARMPSKAKKSIGATTAYPPKPIPIDEGWEIVDPQQPVVDKEEQGKQPQPQPQPQLQQQQPQQQPQQQQQPLQQQQQPLQLHKDEVAAAPLPETPKQNTKQAAPTPARSTGRKRRLTSENRADKASTPKATPRKKRQQEEPSATPPVTRSAKRARQGAR